MKSNSSKLPSSFIRFKFRNVLLFFTVLLLIFVNLQNLIISHLGEIHFGWFFMGTALGGLLLLGYLGQVLFILIEKFTYRPRIITVLMMTLIFAVIYFFPFGFFSCENSENNDVLIAIRNGPINCMTEFKLKKNNLFVEEISCFGLHTIHGNYTLKGDTVFFSNVYMGWIMYDYYRFAVIRTDPNPEENYFGFLNRYYNNSDSFNYPLRIVKNELLQMK